MTCKISISKYALDKKIPSGSEFWPKFNASFDNVELGADMILQSVYDGHAITTWHKNNWRHTDNYLCGQHIGLDFDAGDKTSSLLYLMKDKFIQKYASFLYTTISHTPEAPRARAIFLLDKPIMQPKNYTLAASALLWLFGTADRQCKDAVRFFYGSPLCDCEYLDNVLPLEVVQKLIKEYQATGEQEKRQASTKNYANSTPEQKEVEKALKLIPPWGVDYTEWVEILMGIHSAFGDAGFSLAASWADGKPGEVEQKWKSFHDNKSGGVTIATVFGIAKRYGWRKI